MARYIDADRLYKDITRSIDYCEDILEILERQPAADVQEVRHGRWRNYEGMLTCAVCGMEFYNDIMEYTGDEVPRYCPNCGALMVNEDD